MLKPNNEMLPRLTYRLGKMRQSGPGRCCCNRMIVAQSERLREFVNGQAFPRKLEARAILRQHRKILRTRRGKAAGA